MTDIRLLWCDGDGNLRVRADRLANHTLDLSMVRFTAVGRFSGAKAKTDASGRLRAKSR